MPRAASSYYARLARDVRQAQIQQTGMKNYQAVRVVPIITVFTKDRVAEFIELGSPKQFREFLAPRLPRDKYYVRSMQAETVIHNACNFPVRMTAYHLQPRCNITQTYEEIYPTGVPTPELPYTDPTASPLFKRLFDVTHVDTQLVPGGMPFVIKQSKFFPSLRVMSYNIEGSTDFTLTPLSSVVLLTVECTPLNFGGSGPTDTTSFSVITCNATNTWKITYYADIAKRPFNQWDTNSGTQIQQSEVWTDVVFRQAATNTEVPIRPYP